MGVDRRAVALALASCAGFAIAIYLTIAHYTDAPLACVTTGPIDCAAVTNSTFSLIPGTAIPITIPGLAWFAVSGALSALALTRREPPWGRALHLAWTLAGVVAVLYLVYAELVVIRRICEWCTVVHVLVVASFLLTLARLQDAGSDA